LNEVRICGLKHQKEKRSMDHFAGLDVSVKETKVCIVDDTGKIVWEVKVLAQGLGDADRQASREEKGDRGAGTPVGRDHAPHLG
jgi:hypothetical protein